MTPAQCEVAAWCVLEAAMRCWLEQHERNEDAWQAGYAAAEAAWSKAVHDA
jgi:hypothetical protein